MSMTEWAEKEIEIACQKENPDRKEGEWDYGCACYESALKAYKSLMEDGHSGLSFGITRSILVRLMYERPLTPIEDTPDSWNHITCSRKGYTTYQCKRMSSLFKDVYKDGTVKYTDINRERCIDIKEPEEAFSNGFISKVCDDIYPVTMPYYPTSRPNIVYVDETESTLHILYYLIRDTGQRIDINRYFESDIDGSWVEMKNHENMKNAVSVENFDYVKEELKDFLDNKNITVGDFITKIIEVYNKTESEDGN